MNQADLKRAKELSAQLKKAGVSPRLVIKPKKQATSSFAYKSLGGAKPIWDSKQHIAPKAVVKRAIPSPFKIEYETLTVKDGVNGTTPIKGVDYFTETEIAELKKSLLEEILKDHEVLTEKVVDAVKGSISMKDIKDTDSFIMRSREGMMTRYKFEELMHGGGANTTSSSPALTPTGTVNAVNTVFTVTAEPTSVVSDGITYFDGAGYTYAALTIIMEIPPSQYIRYYV